MTGIYELVAGAAGWELFLDGDPLEPLGLLGFPEPGDRDDELDSVLEAAALKIGTDGHTVKAWEYVERDSFRAVLA